MLPRLLLVVIAVMGFAGCKPPSIAISETQVKVTKERTGRGKPADAGDIVALDYRVLLPDGSVVLEDERFRFKLGTGAVIAGIDDAVLGMKAGGHRTATCPPHKHWGRQGYATIPPNTTLTLELDLVRIE
jgi:FKBP-type peptidyl-prolyl cis-trans isomerase